MRDSLRVQPLDESLHRHLLVVGARPAPVPPEVRLSDPEATNGCPAVRLEDPNQDPLRSELRLHLFDLHVHVALLSRWKRMRRPQPRNPPRLACPREESHDMSLTVAAGAAPRRRNTRA